MAMFDSFSDHENLQWSNLVPFAILSITAQFYRKERSYLRHKFVSFRKKYDCIE